MFLDNWILIFTFGGISISVCQQITINNVESSILQKDTDRIVLTAVVDYKNKTEEWHKKIIFKYRVNNESNNNWICIVDLERPCTHAYRKSICYCQGKDEFGIYNIVINITAKAIYSEAHIFARLTHKSNVKLYSNFQKLPRVVVLENRTTKETENTTKETNVDETSTKDSITVSEPDDLILLTKDGNEG
ncbi:uncharacterized protein LOC131941476 [Physella acuta]|uniref:uncharacterized protein LOC131941476 n=1 Tax=Physella acuta TaxID=109671 RepID=UPI0027DC8F03|nr:uncharacterized protein LOC131941476 [Physella acuta]